jgi:hypothetical protein
LRAHDQEVDRRAKAEFDLVERFGFDDLGGHAAVRYGAAFDQVRWRDLDRRVRTGRIAIAPCGRAFLSYSRIPLRRRRQAARLHRGFREGSSQGDMRR